MSLASNHSRQAFGSKKLGIDYVKAAFCDYFERVGYTKVETEPLIPRTDKTVLFSNATITPLKEKLLGDEGPQIGWVIDQPCLRLQNLSDCPSPDFDPEYMSFFNMVGVFAPSLNRDYVWHIAEALKECGLKPEQIKLRGCRRDKDMMEVMSKVLPAETEVEVCGRYDGYFDWKYDMNGYRGRGFHIMIKQPDGTALSIGQIVEISENNHVRGYEFGFGSETFLSRLRGTESVYTEGLFVDTFGLAKNNLERQYYDILTSAIAMATVGVQPGKGGRSSVLRKSLRTLAVLEQGYHCPIAEDEQVASLQKNISEALNLTEPDMAIFQNMLNTSRTNLRDDLTKFHQYVKERRQSIGKGIATIERAEQKTNDYADKLNIPPYF